METRYRRRPGRPKGFPKTGGRKKGTPNKLTRSLKEAILGALDEVGGQSYLAKVARDDPRTFCGLLGRLLPSEIKARVDGALSHEEALAELEGRLERYDAGRTLAGEHRDHQRG